MGSACPQKRPCRSARVYEAHNSEVSGVTKQVKLLHVNTAVRGFCHTHGDSSVIGSLSPPNATPCGFPRNQLDVGIFRARLFMGVSWRAVNRGLFYSLFIVSKNFQQGPLIFETSTWCTRPKAPCLDSYTQALRLLGGSGRLSK